MVALEHAPGEKIVSTWPLTTARVGTLCARTVVVLTEGRTPKVEPHMNTAVSYCRVSSDEQAARDISIPAQRKAIHRWVENQPDVTIVRDFVDEGQSAYAPADRRPGFCEMMSWCRKNKVKYILVHKLDRFSRNQEESIIFKSMLRKEGIQVRSITETFDSATPQGFLYEGMIEVINQFYSMNLATETMKGMRENAERGYINGGVTPYGYQRVKVEERGREHGRLVPGPPEAVAIVQRIFTLATEHGMGSKAMVQSPVSTVTVCPAGR